MSIYLLISRLWIPSVTEGKICVPCKLFQNKKLLPVEVIMIIFVILFIQLRSATNQAEKIE